MSEHSTRRGWMLAVGIALLVIGLVGAGALWYGGGQRQDDNVAGFARAPSGCATTLDFERGGQFTVYVETKGTVDELTGDCAGGGDYDRADTPDADVALVDPEGSPVDVEESSGADYDTGAFVGSAVGVIQIDAPGDYVLTVQADGEPFAVAVGGDPNEGVAPLRWGAVAMAIAGLIIGGVLLVFGSRRSPEPDAVQVPWQPAPADWPTSPPGFPAPPPTTGAAGPAGSPGPPRLPPPPTVVAPGEPAPPAGWGPPGPG